eukprot:6213990-Pleurochrysis_carterae.AAC.4
MSSHTATGSRTSPESLAAFATLSRRSGAQQPKRLALSLSSLKAIRSCERTHTHCRVAAFVIL